MLFEGRNLNRVSAAFKDHLNQLLAHTVTRTPMVVFIQPQDHVARISFRHGGGPNPTPVRTRFGPMELFLGQTCDVVDGVHDTARLRTLSYGYTLTLLGSSEPLFRWEYERFPSPGSFWCQHHLQGPIDLNVGRGTTVSLNDLHLPTGPVPIKEVIRFLIVDLGVSPLDASVDDDGVPGWHRRLVESSSRLSDA